MEAWFMKRLFLGGRGSDGTRGPCKTGQRIDIELP